MVSPQKNLSLMAFSGRAWPAAQHFCVIVLCLKRKKNSFFLREFRPISRLRFSLLPSSFLLQMLNPSCVLDQALEDSPSGTRVECLSVAGRVTFVTARRLDGHRAEAGGGEGHGRAPGASLGRPCSAGASPSGTRSVAVGPRSPCFLTPFASAAPLCLPRGPSKQAAPGDCPSSPGPTCHQGGVHSRIGL